MPEYIQSPMDAAYASGTGAVEAGAGLRNAADITQAAGNTVSAIPIFGQVVSGVTTIGSTIMKMIAAKKQKEQAEKLRADALRTQKQGLRPEFMQKKRIDEMAYLSGLAGMETAKQGLDAATANQMRTIQESSPNGAATVAAISAALGQNNKSVNDLNLKNLEYKAGKLSDVGNTQWSIGEKQRELENIRDARMKDTLTASSALENASMANSTNAVDTVLNTIGSTASSLSQGSGMSDDQFKKMLAAYLAKTNGGK